MDTIELKFKLDIIFGYVIPIAILIGYGILCLISYLIKKYKKKGD